MNERLPENKYAVNSHWLAQQLENRKIVIVDCRFQLNQPEWGYEQYLKGHIPGAYYLDLNRDLSSAIREHGGRHPLPNIKILAQKFSSLGINSDRTLVVVYDDSRLAFASRLWWLLRYLGHESVAILDGGWQAWQKGGYPIDKKIPEPAAGNFIPQIQTNWTVDIDRVKASKDLPNTILIDSRDRDRYAGEREPIDPVAGSIPGAVNSPWKKVTDDLGFLLPLEKQQQLWSSYSSAEDIIVYCGSGVTACVNLFSLNLAGFEDAKLYPGGWSDWCSYLSNRTNSD